jgi:hypothetical protein
MAARKTYVRDGITLRRTIGGYACRINETSGTFTFRRQDDGSWKPNGQYHKGQPISTLSTLRDCVDWAKGHVSWCKESCAAGSGPFDNVKVEPNDTGHATDDCHTYS